MGMGNYVVNDNIPDENELLILNEAMIELNYTSYFKITGVDEVLRNIVHPKIEELFEDTGNKLVNPDQIDKLLLWII